MDVRKKLLKYGVSSLTTAELLSIIISGPNSMTVAENVVQYATDNVGSLGRILPEELTTIDGIGINKACAISATIELAKRLNEDTHKRDVIKNSEDVYALMSPLLIHEKQEHFITLLLNSKGEVESKEVISIGGLSSACIDPREVFTSAIRKCAAAMVLIHNHPSGDPTPSDDDIHTTNRLIEASRILGIQILDHVIIGRNQHHSMRNNNDCIF